MPQPPAVSVMTDGTSVSGATGIAGAGTAARPRNATETTNAVSYSAPRFVRPPARYVDLFEPWLNGHSGPSSSWFFAPNLRQPRGRASRLKRRAFPARNPQTTHPEWPQHKEQINDRGGSGRSRLHYRRPSVGGLEANRRPTQRFAATIDRVSIAFKELDSGASLARFNAQLGVADGRLDKHAGTSQAAALVIGRNFDNAALAMDGGMSTAATRQRPNWARLTPPRRPRPPTSGA